MSNKQTAIFYTVIGIVSVAFAVIASDDTVGIIGINCILAGSVVFAIEDKGKK